jgi:hypothetical protein
MKSIFCLMSLFIVVSGCATRSQIMINPTTKHQVTCSTDDSAWWDVPANFDAMTNYRDCINKNKIMGYVPLEEFEKSEAQKLNRQGEVKAP